MGARSSIKSDPRVRAAVDAALARGATIDEITDALAAAGTPRSRSAVGRYAAEHAQLIANERDIKALGAAFGEEFGKSDDPQSRLVHQLINSLLARTLVPMLAGEQVKVSPMDVHFFARAAKDIASAQKTDEDRRRAIRRETLDEAEKVAVSSAKSAGASDDVIARIKADFLGMRE